MESLMSSAQRRKLADISNLQEMNREETQQQQNMIFSSKEYTEKLKQENMTLMKALAHRNKIIELSGVEIQKLRINFRNVQEKNLQLAQANSQMLAELNTSKDSLKLLQHELGCTNVLLKAKKMLLEVPANAAPDGNAKSIQAHDMNQKDTKKKRTSTIKPSKSSNVKSIQVKENSKRKAGVIDTNAIPEQTSQTVEKGQTVDNLVNNKFVLDAVNPIKDSVHSKRQCVRRKSTRFDVEATKQTEKLLEMDDAKETKDTARLPLRRQSARLRPEETEPCKIFNEGDKVSEKTTKRGRFDFREPEANETLNARDGGSLLREEEGTVESISQAVKHRVSTRRQSTKSKFQTATETVEAIKETATHQSLVNNIFQECRLKPSTTNTKEEKEHGRELQPKEKPKAEETQGTMRRTSVGRPSRHAAEKVQSYREVSLKVKMRRN